MAATGPRHALGQGSGAQQILGAPPALGPASGPQRALDRDPARGFPPRDAPSASDSSFTPGYPPGPAGPPVPFVPSSPFLPSGPLGPGGPLGPPGPPGPLAGEFSPQRLVERGDSRTDSDRYGDGPDDGRPGRGGRRRRIVILGAAAVLVLGIAGAAAYKYVGSPSPIATPSSLKLPASDPTAGSPLFSAKLGKWQHIDTRKLDPAPVTVNGLYPPAFMYPAVNGTQYLRATASLTKTCGLAVFGDLLQAALQSGGCSQIVRASYVSGNGQIMGTIGVANLSSAYEAELAAKTTGSDELIAPLTATKGPTRNFLKSGTGLAYAEIKGHYLILFYVEFTDLKSPSGNAQKQELLNFADGMFGGSANIGLSDRLLGQKS